MKYNTNSEIRVLWDSLYIGYQKLSVKDVPEIKHIHVKMYPCETIF